jgi:hypothetical protein
MGYTNEDVPVREARQFSGVVMSAERRVVALTVNESTQQVDIGDEP